MSFAIYLGNIRFFLCVSEIGIKWLSLVGLTLAGVSITFSFSWQVICTRENRIETLCFNITKKKRILKKVRQIPRCGTFN